MKKYQKISWNIQKTNKVLQLYNKGLEYCLLSEKYEQCHQFVWCKDYLHDVVYSTVNKTPIEIFNFYFDPKKNKIPATKKIKICVADNKSKYLYEKFSNCINFLNKIETKLKMKKSKCFLCKNPPVNFKDGSVLIIEGDRRWLSSPPMISLYAMLIRIGFCHNKINSYNKTFQKIIEKKIKLYQPRDTYNFKSSFNGIKTILENNDQNIFFKNWKYNYPIDVDILRVHNYLGISNFSLKFGIDVISDWYKNIIKNKRKKRKLCSR